MRDLTQSLRILIVDDHADCADLAAELVGERGYVTRVAYGPQPAIAIAASFHPHLVLLDIHLPMMNGYELATHLRANPLLADCRFIAVTGNADETDRRDSEAAGFSGHLAKPFGAEALFEAVDGHHDAASCAPPEGCSVC